MTSKKHIQLASTTFSIWHFHDVRDFNNLRRIVSHHLALLGAGPERYQSANHITRAYLFHSVFDDVFNNVDSKVVSDHEFLSLDYHTRKFETELIHAFQCVGETNAASTGHHHAMWWKYYLLKNRTGKARYKLLILWHLFLQHWSKFPWSLDAFLSTYYLIRAGFYGHDVRSKTKSLTELAHYWAIVFSHQKNILMF